MKRLLSAGRRMKATCGCTADTYCDDHAPDLGHSGDPWRQDERGRVYSVGTPSCKVCGTCTPVAAYGGWCCERALEDTRKGLRQGMRLNDPRDYLTTPTQQSESKESP